MAKVPEVDEALRTHKHPDIRAATRAALEAGTEVSDVAESIVDYSEDRLIAGDTMFVDEAMFNAVHDGVPPHVLFTEIKKRARKVK